MDRDSIPPFEQERFLARRRRQKRHGWIFMVLGGFIFLDSYAPFPIPLVGPISLLIGFVLFCYGYYQYNGYRSLPVYEALQVAHSHNGQVTRTELFVALQMTPEQTDLLIQELIKNGFFEPIEDETNADSELRYRLIA